MTQRRALALVGLAAVLLAIGLASLPAAVDGGADGSSLSRGPLGLLVARSYVEAQGGRAVLLDSEAPAKPAVRGALVVTFPWQRWSGREATRALEGVLAGGGTVVLGYSMQPMPSAETSVFASLGLGEDRPRGEPPLNPLRWRRYTRETWSLAAGDPGRPPVVVRAPAVVPRAPAGASVWYRGPKDVPMVFSYRRGRGRVIALPAEALANARLGEAGNAELLERLRAELPGRWTFDEFHHGLAAPETADPGSRSILDFYLLHLLFLYVLAGWMVVRRFGAPWLEPVAALGTARGFLVGLGSLHDRLGHHAHAAARLVERAREFDPRLRFPESTGVRDRAGLLSLARRLGRVQARMETPE